MRRVLVVGSPGAGKSTFARELARLTRLPLTHLDAEYWRPGWVRPAQAEWRTRVESLIAPDTWILDGNYTSTVPLRASRADTVVVLDYPRTLCLFRATGRALLGRRPDTLCLGREPLNPEFLRFIWNFPAVQERQMSVLQALPHLKVKRLRSDREARTWLRNVANSGNHDLGLGNSSI